MLFILSYWIFLRFYNLPVIAQYKKTNAHPVTWKVIMFETKKTSIQHVLQIIWEIRRYLWISLPKVKCWDSEKNNASVFMEGTEVCEGMSFKHCTSWVLSCWNSQFSYNLVNYQVNHNCKYQIIYLEKNWDGSRVASKFSTKLFSP